MNEKEVQMEMDVKIEGAFASLTTAIDELLHVTCEAIKPRRKLYDLRAACEYKGVNYKSVSSNRHMQPMAGYSGHTEGRKRYWTEAQVEEWSLVNSEQRPMYYESLLAMDSVSAGVLAELMSQASAGTLPENIVFILDEYAYKSRGKAV